MNRLLLILSLFIFLASCNKERTFSVKATNKTTGSPLVNFEYYVLAHYKIGGEEKSETVEYGKTDFQGLGIVSLKMKRGRRYTLHCVQPGNTCFINEPVFELDRKNIKSEYQFELEKCGALNLKIENIGCTGYADKMNYRIKNSSGVWQPWSQDYMGCYYAPATGISLTKGTIKLQWTVQKTGYSYADSVTLNIYPNAATLFHLQY